MTSRKLLITFDPETNRALRIYCEKYNITLGETMRVAVRKIMEREAKDDPEMQFLVEKIKKKEAAKKRKEIDEQSTSKMKQLHLPVNTIKRIYSVICNSIMFFEYIDMEEVQLVINEAKEKYEATDPEVKKIIKNKMQRVYIKSQDEAGLHELFEREKALRRIKEHERTRSIQHQRRMVQQPTSQVRNDKIPEKQGVRTDTT